MTNKQLSTLSKELKAIEIKDCAKIFELAAAKWIEANNYGKDDEIYRAKLAEVDELQKSAETILKEIYPGIVIYYPGLYPAFKYKDNNHINLEDLTKYAK
jgi:hypothetical protein